MTDRYRDLDQVWDDRTFGLYSSVTKHPWRWVAGFVGLILAVSLIGNAVGVANIYWQAQRAKLTVSPRVTRATYGTDNALHNIAYFHDQCNTILADQQNVINALQTLTTDKQTFANASDPIAQQQAGAAVTQDESTLTGTKDQLSNDVRDYDSKSATQTANPFKAASLPYRIDLNPATGLLAGSVRCH